MARAVALALLLRLLKSLKYYSASSKRSYDAVDHDQHDEAPKDHLAINLRAALVKTRSYYSKLNHSLEYYAATILHPRYTSFCDSVWAEKPE
jgi:hypothetical protein